MLAVVVIVVSLFSAICYRRVLVLTRPIHEKKNPAPIPEFRPIESNSIFFAWRILCAMNSGNGLLLVYFCSNEILLLKLFHCRWSFSSLVDACTFVCSHTISWRIELDRWLISIHIQRCYSFRLVFSSHFFLCSFCFVLFIILYFQAKSQRKTNNAIQSAICVSPTSWTKLDPKYLLCVTCSATASTVSMRFWWKRAYGKGEQCWLAFRLYCTEKAPISLIFTTLFFRKCTFVMLKNILFVSNKFAGNHACVYSYKHKHCFDLRRCSIILSIFHLV